MPIRIYEKDIESLIFDNYTDFFWGDDVDYLKNYHKAYRQYSLDPYGTPDIVAFNRRVTPWDDTESSEIEIHIIEMKAENLTAGHLTQLLRYYKGAKDIANYARQVVIDASDIHFRLTLLGTRADTSTGLQGDDLVYLFQEIRKSMAIYDCSIEIGLFDFGVNGLEISYVEDGWHREISTEITPATLAGDIFSATCSVEVNW